MEQFEYRQSGYYGTKVKDLGQGTFGNVYLTNQGFAIKLMSYEDDGLSRISVVEIATMNMSSKLWMCHLGKILWRL